MKNPKRMSTIFSCLEIVYNSMVSTMFSKNGLVCMNDIFKFLKCIVDLFAMVMEESLYSFTDEANNNYR